MSASKNLAFLEDNSQTNHNVPNNKEAWSAFSLLQHRPKAASMGPDNTHTHTVQSNCVQRVKDKSSKS